MTTVVSSSRIEALSNFVHGLMILALGLSVSGCGGPQFDWSSASCKRNSEVFLFSTRAVAGYNPERRVDQQEHDIPVSSLTNNAHRIRVPNSYDASAEASIDVLDGYFLRADYGPELLKGQDPQSTRNRKMPIDSNLTVIPSERFYDGGSESNRTFVGALGSSYKPTLTLFVHGYNVSPKAAIERTVMLDHLFNYEFRDERYQAAAAPDGRYWANRLTMGFVWPSHGKNAAALGYDLLPYLPWYFTNFVKESDPWSGPNVSLTNTNIHTHYLGDATLVDFAAFQLAGMMGTLEAKGSRAFGDEFKVDIVAHSMGTEILAKAFLLLSDLEQRGSEDPESLGFVKEGAPTISNAPKLRNIVLMGGDIPVEKLVRILPGLDTSSSGRVLIILNRKDTVVQVSASFQRQIPRLSTATWSSLAGRIRNNSRVSASLEKRITILDITDAAESGPSGILKNHNPLSYPWAAQAIKHFLEHGRLREGRIDTVGTPRRELVPIRQPSSSSDRTVTVFRVE